MAFHNVTIPDTISRGAEFGPKFSTQVVETFSGGEYRNAKWPTGRVRANIGYGIRDKSDMDTLISFFRARKGAAYSFRLKDWTDYQVSSAQQFGTGDGATTTFQLIKAYTDGVVTVNRNITKPRSGIVVRKAGVTQTLTTHYTVDLSTGIVTFLAAPANGAVLDWTGEFDICVRFINDEMAVTAETYDAMDWPDIPVIEVDE